MESDKNQQFLSIDNGIVRIKRVPPGFRFCPTEEELIVKYLMKKVKNEALPPNLIIPEVDVYQYNPAILCENYKGVDEKEWYFFSPRERKYPNGSKAKRSTNEGHWKNYGAGKKSIYSEKRIVGKRRILTYFQGKIFTGIKTNWNMKEYTLVNNSPHQRTRSNTNMKLDDFVLCKIYKRVSYHHHVGKKPNERKRSYDEKLLMHQEKLHQEKVSAIMPKPQDHGGVDGDDRFSFLDRYPLEVLQEMARELEDLEDLACLVFRR